tara:strand:+ start:50 stop:211 length:162 start_codon:yes stop_codon:yes gene_type:complete
MENCCSHLSFISRGINEKIIEPEPIIELRKKSKLKGGDKAKKTTGQTQKNKKK